jgi:hypothetical protein
VLVREGTRYFVPGIDKAPGLRAMARRCFADTFGHLFDRESFEQFLDEAYGDGGSMSKDLLNSAIEWLTAETGVFGLRTSQSNIDLPVDVVSFLGMAKS